MNSLLTASSYFVNYTQKIGRYKRTCRFFTCYFFTIHLNLTVFLESKSEELKNSQLYVIMKS